MPTKDRDLWDLVEKRGPRECWPFVGTINSDGYGVVYVDGSHRYAHVLACESKHGPMRPGEVARHMCAERSARRVVQLFGGEMASIGIRTERGDVLDRRCCNPDHLSPGSVRANALDRERARRAR